MIDSRKLPYERYWSSLFFAALIFCATSCKKNVDNPAVQETESTKTVKVNDLGRDFLVPSVLWDRISGLDLVAAAQQTGTVVYLPITVKFTEKNSGVLVKPVMIFEFGKGGGDLDLAQVTTGQTGTFFMQFQFQGFEAADSMSIYYVSAGRKRQVEGDIWGSGCNRFMDIKKYIVSQNQQKGLEVNTYRDRHITMLAGHFIFSTQVNKQVLVTQVSIHDSTKPMFLCENLLLKRRSKNLGS